MRNFQGMVFILNTNIQGDLQICSVPLTSQLMYFMVSELFYWLSGIQQTELIQGSFSIIKPIIKPIIRGSRLEVFCKKAVLRNAAKFTGKRLRQSLFFNKVAGLSQQLY